MKWRPYPNYKASGVEWLGEVPAHWEIIPLKHRCIRSALYGANIPGEEYAPDGVRFLRTTDIDDFGRLNAGGVFIEPDQAQGYELADRDILLSRSGTIGRAFVYSAQQHPRSAYAGYLVRFVPSPLLNATFVFYFTKSTAFRDWLDTQVIASTIGNVNGQKYSQCPIPMANRIEQDAIAEFLDRETAKIDTLVTKKRTLIERLKEKRTALISRTVTRGLPPDAARAAGLDPHPMLKPTGVDWLGDVPEHWDVTQLKWAVMFQRGHDLPADDRDEGIVPLVSSSGVSATHSQAIARGPGIVTGRYGTIGQFYLIEKDYWPLNTTLYSIDLRGNEPRFLTVLLTHLAPLFLLNAVKSAVPGIDRNDIHPVATVLPPKPEQAAIADFLDRQTARLDGMVAKIETAIERLKEYRTALITAAVTGRIDVREAMA